MIANIVMGVGAATVLFNMIVIFGWLKTLVGLSVVFGAWAGLKWSASRL